MIRKLEGQRRVSTVFFRHRTIKGKMYFKSYAPLNPRLIVLKIYEPQTCDYILFHHEYCSVFFINLIRELLCLKRNILKIKFS